MDIAKNYRTRISELGRKLKVYRISKELSQQDLAEKTGVSLRSISRLEQGESVQLETLFKIMSALGLGDNIDLLVPDETRRPSFYLTNPGDGPKRVRRRTKKSGFQWGDEA